MTKNAKGSMKKVLLYSVIFIMLTVSVATASAQSFNGAEVGVFIDEITTAQVEEYNVPNATIAVVVDGELVFQKGYGYANLEEQTAVDPEQTLFRVGSISKLFTWTAIMQLVEQGKIDLNADVNTYLDFEIPATLLKSVGTTEPVPITVEHLLTHTPGFEDAITGLFAIEEDRFLSLGEYVKGSVPKRIYPAGEVLAYSNYGASLAGYIVEQVSGLSYEEYMEQNILAPLGMNMSTSRQPLPEQLAPYMARAYRSIDGEFLERGFEFMPVPAGGVSATAADMSKFMLAHLQGGSNDSGRILAEETVKQMHSQQFTHHPKVAGMTYGFIENYVNGQRVLSHAGSTMLFDSGFYLLPEQNVGIFMSYSGGNYLVHTEIFQDFMDQYFPAEQTAPLEQVAGAAERAKQYVGEYHANRKAITTSDRLLSLLTGVMSIKIDDNGYLIATTFGERNQFIETEPGIYENIREGRSGDPYGQFRTIVFATDPYGKQMLITDGPMTYTEPAWYASRMFTVAALLISISIVVGSLIYWLIALIVRKVKGTIVEQSNLAVFARWMAVLFGLVFVAIATNILGSSELDPVYQLPIDAYDPTPELLIMRIFSILLSASAMPLLVFTIYAWWYKHWSIGGRIHYTVYAGAALMLLWMLRFWNVL